MGNLHMAAEVLDGVVLAYCSLDHHGAGNLASMSCWSMSWI